MIHSIRSSRSLITVTLLSWTICTTMETDGIVPPQEVSHAASTAEVPVISAVVAGAEPPENERFAFVRETVKRYLEVPEALASTSDIECAMEDVLSMPYKIAASPLTKNALDTFNKNKKLPAKMRKRLN